MITKKSAIDAIVHINAFDMISNGHIDIVKMFNAIVEAINNIPDEEEEEEDA